MRARINERLEQATRFPVTLIVAPAGFGKSVALRDFLQSRHIEAVRYDVRREDGTLLAFVRRLSEALQGVAPTAIAAFPAMQERILASSEPVRQLSDWFVEHLKEVACTVVIDDLHYAAVEPASIALLADLIERTGERIRWIIAARSDAGLPVATWIAYGNMDLPVGEDDLRFTTDEALAAADSFHAGLDLQEIESLRQLTEGWPVALTIALRTRTHAADLRSATAGTREMVYRYLAEQILRNLNPQERALAFATSVFSGFDREMCEALGATPASIEQFRAKVAFLNEDAPGHYRYHELFREFLETELRRSGEREWVEALCRGARLMEARENHLDALILYTKARSGDDLVRIMEQRGFALFEEGQSEALSAAVAAVPDHVGERNATILGLRALIEASRGRFSAAEPFFRSAIESAVDRELRLSLVQWYAIECIRRGKNCIDLIEPYANDSTIAPHMRVALLGTLATAYAATSNFPEMRVSIGRALEVLDGSVGNHIRARLYQQLSHCMYVDGNVDSARSYAELAADIAIAYNYYEIAARAYVNLSSSSYDLHDDPLEFLSLLEKVDECAKKGASTQARLFALLGFYEVEVERGNDSRIEALDRLVKESESLFPQGYRRALLPAEAMRAGWERDFKTAYMLLVSAENAEATDERRALRLSEIAVYGLAGGLPQEGERAIDGANAALAAVTRHTPRTERARLFLALAELLRGRTSAAQHHLTGVEQRLPPAMRRLRALAACVRAYYRSQLGNVENAELEKSLDRLEREQFGGMARLLAALPLATAGDQTFSALTSSEREILALLADGASTKDIARTTGRSPHTIDTHIRSICRKLACSGRREAVALAVRAGWVHA